MNREQQLALFNENKINQLESDCARFKALLADASVLLDMSADVLGKGKLHLKFDKQLKKEGIG